MGHGLVSQGCIAMVYGLNMERMNCDRVFNLFCLYGNVDRVGMFLPSFFFIPNSLVILCRLPADFVLSKFEFSFYIYICVLFCWCHGICYYRNSSMYSLFLFSYDSFDICSCLVRQIVCSL